MKPHRGFAAIMAKPGSVVVAVGAILIGGLIAVGGVLFMLQAESFFAAESERESGLFGLWGSSSDSAEMNTPAWVGLLAALLGGALLMFGFRALYATFEGREVQ